MADEKGFTLSTVMRALITEPQAYSFLQAISLILAYFKQNEDLSAEQVLQQALVRLRPSIHLHHPNSDIESIEVIKVCDPALGVDREVLKITVNFMGLYGVDSPLPNYYLDEFAQGDEENSAKRAFIDIFHHRILSLYFQAAQKYHYSRQYDSDLQDPMSSRLLCLLGLGASTRLSKESEMYLGVPLTVQLADLPIPQDLFPYISCLRQANPSAQTLENILKKVLEVEVKVESFVEQILPIKSEHQFQLGKMNTILGDTATLGIQFKDISGKIRLHLGPLSLDEYKSFLPEGLGRKKLDILVKFLLKAPLNYQVCLILSSCERQSLRLFEQYSDKPNRPQLGRTTWLGNQVGVIGT